MSSVIPVYPNGLFTWTDRVDQQNIDFANDPNSIASEVISIETTIGTTPQIESSPPSLGNPVTYSTASARISDAMNNNQLPVCLLQGVQLNVPNNVVSVRNNYVVGFDPFNMYNGTDITIPAYGWWIVSNIQRWDWWGDGYVHQTLTLNGLNNLLDEDIIDWEFSGNTTDNDGSGTKPRWQQFGLRPRVSQVFWQGPLRKGDRISIYSENGTSNASFGLDDYVLTASMLRTLPNTIISGPVI